MGRNGAGKSTLFGRRRACSTRQRGRDRGAGGRRAACPSGQPTLLVHERVGDELAGRGRGAERCERSAWPGSADADPRDLSGGERQRLALAIVLAGRRSGGRARPAWSLLDEPTRGMDRVRKPS